MRILMLTLFKNWNQGEQMSKREMRYIRWLIKFLLIHQIGQDVGIDY